MRRKREWRVVGITDRKIQAGVEWKWQFELRAGFSWHWHDMMIADPPVAFQTHTRAPPPQSAVAFFSIICMSKQWKALCRLVWDDITMLWIKCWRLAVARGCAARWDHPLLSAPHIYISFFCIIHLFFNCILIFFLICLKDVYQLFFLANFVQYSMMVTLG